MILKLILTLIASFCGIYMAGDMVRQNQSLDRLLANAESFYSVLNKRVSDTEFLSGLRALRRIYGWLALAACISFAVSSAVVGSRSTSSATLSSVAIFSLFSWFSVLWCMDHKAILTSFLPHAALMVLGPVAIGLMDLALGSGLTSILVQPILQASTALHLNWVPPQNPLLTGLFVSIFMALLWLVQYALAWLACIPFALLAGLLLSLALFFTRAIDRTFPRRPFVGLVVFLFLGSTLWLFILQ